MAIALFPPLVSRVSQLLVAMVSHLIPLASTGTHTHVHIPPDIYIYLHINIYTYTYV